MDPKNLDQEVMSDRTNNVSEGFNSVLNKHIGIYKPSLAVFVSKIRDLEIHYRKKTLLNISQGKSNTSIEKPNSDQLPFSQIYCILEGRQKEILEAGYNLRSNKTKSDVINLLFKLSHDCFNYLYGSKDLIAGTEDEPEPSIIYIEFNNEY